MRNSRQRRAWKYLWKEHCGQEPSDAEVDELVKFTNFEIAIALKEIYQRYHNAPNQFDAIIFEIARRYSNTKLPKGKLDGW